MITRMLHAITDISTSRRGKFFVLGLWLVLAIGLKVATPSLAKLYDNTANQRIPSEADSQVAQSLLQRAFPQNNGTPAIIVFHDPGGLGVADRILIHQASDWLSSEKSLLSVSTIVSPMTVPQANGTVNFARWYNDDSNCQSDEIDTRFLGKAREMDGQAQGCGCCGKHAIPCAVGTGKHWLTT